MAFIVLGVGAVMVLAGAGEIYYGIGMLEIERGWSTFIAGTVLLTGGLLTLALGLALRSLGEVRGALLQLAGGAAAALPRGTAEIAIPAREPPVQLRPAETAAAIAAGATALQIEPHFGGAEAPIEAEEAPPLRLREDPAVARYAEAPAAEAVPPPQDRSPHVGDDGSALARDEHASAIRAEVPRHDEAREDLRAERHAGMPAETDHVYADFVEVAPPEAAAYEPGHASAPPIAAEPAPTPAAPAPAPAQSAVAQSAVIGRYESDGTSYVMYADGSIEAQSEAGIYRFASMAELKSFIET